MQDKPFRIVLLGSPGSGKGTQGELLASTLSVPRLSVGAMLRKKLYEKTPEGIALGECMTKGLAVPGKDLMRMIADWMREHPHGYVIDNLVRSIDQLDEYKKIEKEHAIHLTKVFCLKTSLQEAKYRLLTRISRTFRPDQTEQAVEARFHTFYEAIGPIADYFRKKGIYEEVNADRPIDVVQQDLLMRLTNSSGK